MRKVRVAPKGMGLNDFVAQEEGFFADEGIEVEFDMKTFRGTQSSWKGTSTCSGRRTSPTPRTRTEPDPVRLRLGHHLQRRRRHGPLRAPTATAFRRGRSSCARIRRSASREDLKDVPISVGMRAGSHFNVPYRLEKYLPLEQHQDGQHRRLRRAPEGAARRRGRGGEPAAAADRHGEAARPAHGHRGRVPDAVVGARDGAAGRRARLSARARPRREGAGRRPGEVPAAVGDVRPARVQGRLHKWDFSRSSPAASASSTSRSRARSSTR